MSTVVIDIETTGAPWDSFDDAVAAAVALSPTRSEPAVRRGVRHNTYRRDDGKWAWRYDLFREHPPDADGQERGAAHARNEPGGHQRSSDRVSSPSGRK